ncbi:MAG: NifB/NifX family molybdenum-iron cluster-binding protein [Candidatus Electryonea clarkiae]|nr:NifB/NifX family molybdenum-iron cluster-binding protein [Candidatus Electryonea clarkiae]
MKVAISADGKNMESRVDTRFGRCGFFLIVDLDLDEFNVISNNSSANLSGGAGIQTAQSVIDSGVDSVITGHCGPKAFRALNAVDIKVFSCSDGTVKEAVENFKLHKLVQLQGSDVAGHWA